MRNLFCFFIGLLLFFALQSFQPFDPTDSKIQALKTKLYFANINYPQSNIYLHLDRPSYWANDDLWFKAYLLSTDLSSNIYVELINSSGKVVQKKMFLALKGLAYGDLHLPDTISSGVYQIRSYTNWMRNFDDSWFFRKNFIIWNLKEREITADKNQLQKKDIDLQFFPEGGTLLSTVDCKMAFKAIDQNGKGIDVAGIVVDKNGALISEFASEYKGMGSFNYRPEDGMKYTALINFNGQTKKVDLPESQHTGVSLSMQTDLPDEIQIFIDEVNDGISSDHQYLMVGQIRGIVIFSREIQLKDGQFGIRINKKDIPTGVLQVTLFDSNMIPKCERLTFVNHNDFVHLNIKPDKPNYTTREKVTIGLESLGQGNTPFVANLSMTVYNPDTHLKIEDYPNNILTHFLLLSDLKGVVEEPAWYFKDETPATMRALDNLLLTQGWRRFSWKAILNNDLPAISYLPEASVTVKGKVSTKFLEKPLANSSVTLLFDQMAYKYFHQTTDSLGNFLFNDLYFFDETSILLQAQRANGSKNTWLEIDNSSSVSPPVHYLPLSYQYKNNQKVSTTYQISRTDSALIERKWHITDTILLDDIDIFGLKKKKQDESLFLLYDKGDYALEVKEDDIATDIFDFIQYRLPGVQMMNDGDFGSAPSLRIRGNQGPPLMLLDGFPIDANVLQAMPLSSFEKVEVLNMAANYGSKGIYGALMFTSKKGVRNVEANLPAGIEQVKLMGYSVVREFYSPNYENSEPSILKNDFRSTLYWHPNIWTNSDGKAEVEFYNSDQPGEIQVIVEGFSTDGRLCRGTYSYNVRP